MTPMRWLAELSSGSFQKRYFPNEAAHVSEAFEYPEPLRRTMPRNEGKMEKEAFQKKKFPQLFQGYDQRFPCHQNAVELLPGWSSAFPDELALQAGALPLHDDDRIKWAIASFGDLEGRNVLELGPLEASHTYMLAKAGANVDAIESNELAYLRCLISKEIFRIEKARFYLGDFNKWLEESPKRYDLIVASGVLYHMRDPLRLMESLSRRSDCLYIWSVCVADDNSPPTSIETFMDLRVRLYERGYGRRDHQFCGGPEDHPRWLHRDDILTCLHRLGYDETTCLETNRHPGLDVQTFSFFARRKSAAHLD